MCQVEEEGHSLSDHITKAKFSPQELGLSSALLPLCPLVLSLSAFGRKEAEVCGVVCSDGAQRLQSGPRLWLPGSNLRGVKAGGGQWGFLQGFPGATSWVLEGPTPRGEPQCHLGLLG